MDCYFFIDTEKPVDDQVMSVLCVPCRQTHYPDVGWFWQGSTEGYGPWLYPCQECGLDVSQKELTDEEN